MKTTIFLDIDGVLNNGSNRNDENGLDIDPRNISILRKLLLSIGNYEIVISSDWKYDKGNLAIFSAAYGINYIACTKEGFDNPCYESLRLHQIKDYIKEHKVSKYLIIDDLELKTEHHIQPHGKYGLRLADIEKYI